MAGCNTCSHRIDGADFTSDRCLFDPRNNVPRRECPDHDRPWRERRWPKSWHDEEKREDRRVTVRNEFKDDRDKMADEILKLRASAQGGGR